MVSTLAVGRPASAILARPSTFSRMFGDLHRCRGIRLRLYEWGLTAADGVWRHRGRAALAAAVHTVRSRGSQRSGAASLCITADDAAASSAEAGKACSLDTMPRLGVGGQQSRRRLMMQEMGLMVLEHLRPHRQCHQPRPQTHTHTHTQHGGRT